MVIWPIIAEEKWCYLVKLKLTYIFCYLFFCCLKGSMWAAWILSIFQLLSEDYISYVFFILFVGMAIGAVQVIAVPFVIEMVNIP